MPFPGHWGKGVGGVRGDGVTGPLRQGYFSTSFCHIAWDYVNLKTAFSPEFVMPMAASPCTHPSPGAEVTFSHLDLHKYQTLLHHGVSANIFSKWESKKLRLFLKFPRGSCSDTHLSLCGVNVAIKTQKNKDFHHPTDLWCQLPCHLLVMPKSVYGSNAHQLPWDHPSELLPSFPSPVSTVSSSSHKLWGSVISRQ